MKNLILIISVLFVTFNTNAQCGLPYKPFSDFKGDPTLLNDTLSYLEYNIDKRRRCYIGKTVEVLLNELEIRINGFQPIYNNSEFISRIDLIFSNTRKETQYHGITIYFNEKIDQNSLKELLDKFPENKWVTPHFDFFKNFVIKALSSNDMKRISLEKEYYNRLHEKYGKDFNESMIELK